MKRRKFTASGSHRALVLSKAVSRSRHLCRAAERVQPLAAEDPAIAEILAFIGDGKHRALCLPADDGNKSLMTGSPAAMSSAALEISSPVGVIAAGGVMPFAVADSLPRAASIRCCSRCGAPAIRWPWRAFAITGFRSANSAGP
jgi:hypothetical protein